MKNKFMMMAYKQAIKAFNQDEVPIGVVIVKDGEIIAKAYNQKEKRNLSGTHFLFGKRGDHISNPLARLNEMMHVKPLVYNLD